MGYIFGVVARRSPPDALIGALSPADVAELVDALVSGTSGSNVVGVQVSPSALKKPLLGGAFFVVVLRDSLKQLQAICHQPHQPSVA